MFAAGEIDFGVLEDGRAAELREAISQRADKSA